jgi:hypothetical protein
MADPPNHSSFPPPADSAEVVGGDDDDTLMARMCEGDREAFAVLIQRYGDRLFTYTTTITGSSRLGWDVANETWLGVWGHRTRYPGNGRFIPFILTLAKRKAAMLPPISQRMNVPDEGEIELDIGTQIATVIARLDDPAVMRIAEAEALEAKGEIKEVPIGPKERRRRRLLAILAGAIVLLVALGFLVRTIFFTRGGSGNLAKDVRVNVSVGSRPLEDGAKLDKKSEFSCTYTSAFPRRAYVLVFAVDAAKDVYWIAPPFNDPTQDPGAVEIEHTTSETPLRSSVVFEGVAVGKLTVFAVVTEQVVRVSDIESIPSTERTADRLKARFTGAAIREWKTVVVRK